MEDNSFLHENKIETLMARNESGVKDAISSAFVSTTDLFYDMINDSKTLETSSKHLLTDFMSYSFELSDLEKNTENQTKAYTSLLDSVIDVKLPDIDISDQLDKVISEIDLNLGDNGLNREQIRERHLDEGDTHDNIETIVELLSKGNMEARKPNTRKGMNIIQRAGSMISGLVGDAGTIFGKAGGVLGHSVGGLLSFIPGVGPLLGGILGPLLGGAFGIVGKMLPGLAVIGGSIALLGKMFTGDGSFFFKAAEPFFEVAGEILKEQAKKAVSWLGDKISRQFQWMTTSVTKLIGNSFSMIGEWIKWKATGKLSPDTKTSEDIFSTKKLTKGIPNWKQSVWDKDGESAGWFGIKGKDGKKSSGGWFDQLFSKSKKNVTKDGMDHGVIDSGRTKPLYGGGFNLSRYKPDAIVDENNTPLNKIPITRIPGFDLVSVDFSGDAATETVLTNNDKKPDTLLLSPNDNPNVTDMNLGPKADVMSGYILKAFQDELGDTYQPYITSGRRAPSDPSAITKSKHVKGEAIDIMTRYYPGGPQIKPSEINHIGNALSVNLGSKYNVLYHKMANGGFHFHIAYKPEVDAVRNKFDMNESGVPASQWRNSSAPVPTNKIDASVSSKSKSEEIELDDNTISELAKSFSDIVKINSDEYNGPVSLTN